MTESKDLLLDGTSTMVGDSEFSNFVISEDVPGFRHPRGSTARVSESSDTRLDSTQAAFNIRRYSRGSRDRGYGLRLDASIVHRDN
jgi:hypothetical protein